MSASGSRTRSQGCRGTPGHPGIIEGLLGSSKKCTKGAMRDPALRDFFLS